MSVVNEERNYTVYMHINKKNGKKYIGITKQNPQKRWKSNGIGYCGQLFYNAIEKYGWDNFEHIILFENKTQEEAEKLEVELIKSYKSTNKKHGYNRENGGNSRGKHSEETKQMLSVMNKGKYTKGNSPNAKKVICDNIVYDCAEDCADYYNVKVGVMRGWINCNTSIPKEYFDKGLRYLDGDLNTNIRKEKIKKPTRRKVICDNKIFNTIKECSEYYSINYNTLKGYLNGYCNMPDKFKKLGLKFTNENLLTKSNGKPVVCDGVIYTKIVDCANYYNIDCSVMSSWLRSNHKMPKKFIDLDLRYLNDNTIYEKQTHPRSRKVICDNKIFMTIKEFSEHYNLKQSVVNNWLKGKRGMPKYFLDLELRYLDDNEMIYEEQIKTIKQIICEEKIFNSIKDCSNYYNIDDSLMSSWLNGRCNMRQDFYDMGLRFADDSFNSKIQKSKYKPKIIICENRVFKSIKKCADFYNIKPHNMGRWLNGNRTMPQKYIDLGLRYYNPEVDGDIEQYEQYIETKAI